MTLEGLSMFAITHEHDNINCENGYLNEWDICPYVCSYGYSLYVESDKARYRHQTMNGEQDTNMSAPVWFYTLYQTKMEEETKLTQSRQISNLKKYQKNDITFLLLLGLTYK